jgi:hypothetical protein
MTRTLTTQDISWFLDINKKGQLDLNPPYQRRSVWSTRDKRYFIDTILNDYPAPPIFLHKSLDDNGRPTYHVVDGKQRIQTIIEFSENKIRIPDDFSDINIRKKKFQDVERPTKERFWNYSLIVEMIPDVSESAIRNTFERLNRNSRKLTPQEMRHAKYDGWFITFVETESDKQEWKDFGIVTTARAKRMQDVQFITELCILVIKNSITGFDQDVLDEVYAEYDDISDIFENGTFVSDDFSEEFDRIKKIISESLEAIPELKEYLKIQIHLYSLWAYLHLEKDKIPEINIFAKRYQQFMESVAAASRPNDSDLIDNTQNQTSYGQAVSNYANYSRGATTDQTPRTKRHEALVIGINAIESNCP